ncbi:type IV pilin [Haloarchaeobius baliensis]|uniref:type IV pilin n=1 Tax=Haloarchaeobius baliensis TaxID=1670458 RepID=UPI003F884AF2
MEVWDTYKQTMMDLKALFTEDDAVSPVIGVILMVAITVILAAVIGAFVLNIGGSQETAPQNQFDFEYSATPSGTDGGLVAVTHGGGGSLDATQLSLAGDFATSGTPAPCQVNQASGLSAGDKIVNASNGSACTHGASTGSGAVLEITWTSSSGDNSQIVAESTVP